MTVVGFVTGAMELVCAFTQVASMHSTSTHTTKKRDDILTTDDRDAENEQRKKSATFFYTRAWGICSYERMPLVPWGVAASSHVILQIRHAPGGFPWPPRGSVRDGPSGGRSSDMRELLRNVGTGPKKEKKERHRHCCQACFLPFFYNKSSCCL